ncbi:hypothetical protein EVAR_27253_1 [Eumeta japonica]|uniref:Nucleic-acid-binding protein from transposon X-element n=1 Tax=Eumeta variegata TaxID=151549 RepID=A0A4C1VYD9_EUMVA|nr:hypothetical protein EVAR_27253_1 [Eumeta japonica]
MPPRINRTVPYEARIANGTIPLLSSLVKGEIGHPTGNDNGNAPIIVQVWTSISNRPRQLVLPTCLSRRTHKNRPQKLDYPVFAVDRMHRRNGKELGLVLAVLHKSDNAKDIFKTPRKACSLSDITVEAPYKKSGPGQCFRCQLYGHACLNCYAQPRCIIKIRNKKRLILEKF